MARKAVICECTSNGIFLVRDCIDQGLDPVVVYPPLPAGEDDFAGRMRRIAEQRIVDLAEVIRPADMDDLVSRLEGYDIACVIAGSEYGIPYADRLSYILGLPGNDPSTTPYRTDKLHMHRALKRAGLRHIRTVPVRSEEDITEFWSGKPVIVKPSASVATIGVHLCQTLDECLEAYREDRGTGGWTGGGVGEIVLQDYIDGPEFIVNTLSRDGVHRITDMWAYWKQNVGCGVAYDCAMTVSDPTDSDRATADYALKVLDAVGMMNGPAHLEIKSDADGPVLIEINARPMGGHFTVRSLDIALGHHITDIALRSAVDPGFISTLPEGIPKMRNMGLKVLIMHESRVVDTAPLHALMSHLDGFRNLQCDVEPGVPAFIERTESLASSPASVEILHDDGSGVMEDFAMISAIEKRYPDLLYGFSGDRPEPVPPSDSDIPPDAGVADNDGLHLPEGGFDRYVVRVSDMPLDRFYDTFLEGLRHLRPDGTMTIDPCVFGVVPYGRKGMTALLMIAGLEFDPISDDGGMTATKIRSETHT